MLVFSGMVGRAQSFKIDSLGSQASFSVSKLGWGSVRGTFTGLSGSIIFNTQDLGSSKFDVCIDAGSVKTREPDRDKHLRAEDFFHIKKYPKICFQSRSMMRTRTGYLVTGIISIKGRPKLVNIPFTFENKVFKGKFTLNRKDFDLNDATGMFIIGEEVEIQIICKVQ